MEILIMHHYLLVFLCPLHVENMGDMGNTYRILVGKSELKK
jgi:hypothetical protein